MKDKDIVFRRGKEQDMIYNPPKKLYKFYQICQFPRPDNHLYTIRRYVFNEACELLDVTTYDFKREEVKRFLKTLKIYQYRLCGTFDITTFGCPTEGDIQIMQSEILNADGDVGISYGSV
jgi:hypothetical protein